MPPQLEKNHVVPTSWQNEALARDGVSREVPCSALKGGTACLIQPGPPLHLISPLPQRTPPQPRWPSWFSSPAAHSSPATLAFLILISPSALLPSHAGLPDSQTHQAHYSSGPLHLSHLLHLECSSPFLSRPTSASQPDLGQKCHLLRV